MLLIDYQMTRDYVAHWTHLDAIREFVQNALDTKQKSVFIADEHGIQVISHGSQLPPEALALGHSTKSATTDLGQYGEGFKLAMMVLTRQGLDPQVFSGNTRITGCFKHNDVTKLETFNLVVEDTGEECDGVVFTCKPLEDYSELYHRLPQFTDTPLGIPTQAVDILRDKPGSIYVGGLFICEDSSLTLGYNFRPGTIGINRDRNMATSVTWELAKYFSQSKDADLVFTLLDKDCKDVNDLGYWDLDKDLERDLVKLFYNKYGKGAKLAKPGISYVGSGVAVSNSMYRTMSRSKSVPEAERKVDPKSPEGQLSSFLVKHKKHLRRDVRNELNQLIKQAKLWKSS